MLVWAIVVMTVAHTAVHGEVARADAAVTQSGSDTWGIGPAGSTGGAGRAAFSYELAAGSTIDDLVRITNFSDHPLTLFVGAHDAFNTVEGGFDVLTAARESTGVGTWVTLATSEVTIAAREYVDVPFTLTVPSNAEPGDHAGGVVAWTTTAVRDESGASATVDNRVGTRVYVRVAGPLRPGLTVARLETTFAAEGIIGLGGAAIVSYTIRNTGNVRLAAHQHVGVAGPFGVGRRIVELDDMPELLPGGEFQGRATVESVRPWFRMRTDVHLEPVTSSATALDAADAADLDTIHSSHTWWAIPWRVLVVTAVIIVWWRLRRRSPGVAPGGDAADSAPPSGQSVDA